MNPSTREAPDTLLILLALLVVAALLVPWLPAGHFSADGPISLDTYRQAEQAVPVRMFASGEGVGFLNAPFEGFTSGSRTGSAIGVIAFVLLVGGAFGVIRASGAIDRGVGRLIALTGDRPPLLLAVLFVTFSLGGAVFGMGEETIAFLALLLPLLDRYGYPREVAVMITYMASQIGFGTSWMNPFSVAIAQSIAELPLLSGIEFRLAMWAGFTTLGAVFVLRYAKRHRRVAGEAERVPDDMPLAWVDRAIGAAILATVVWIIWGVTRGGYYIPEIASQFVALGLVSGVLAVAAGRLSANGAAAAFTEGVRQLVPCALVIALAKGLLLLLGGSDPTQPSVLNSLLFALASTLQHWPPLLAAEGMLLAQGTFNLFVTSGSAQAAITMPLMAGLGDLIGVSRQVSVLAFQLGDGLTNLITPVSGTLMGALGVAGVPFTHWLSRIWRFELALLGSAALAVAIAVAIGFR
jgi:uncharacterized ion transporter superfamily protein YfcC